MKALLKKIAFDETPLMEAVQERVLAGDKTPYRLVIVRFPWHTGHVLVLELVMREGGEFVGFEAVKRYRCARSRA